MHQIELEMQNDELQRAQAELEVLRTRYFDLYDLAPVGYLTLTGAALIAEANLAAARLLGVPRDRLINQALSRFVHSDDQDAFFQSWRQAGSSDAPSRVELRLAQRTASGTQRWVQMESSCTADRLASDTACRVTLTEITDLKQTQAELAQHRHHLEQVVGERTRALRVALEAAQSADRAKTRFLANMSHEIRTPLNAIIELNDLLLLETSDDRALSRLNKIAAAAEHLLHIIGDILDLSRIDAGEVALQDVPLSITSLVDECFALLQARAQAKGLRLLAQADPALPQRLIGDPGRLKQVLLNLGDNAIKFSDQGCVWLRARLFEEADDLVGIRLEVEDQGIGLAPGDRERVFAPFVQADDSITRRYGGTGLGLAVVQRIAKLMRGEVGVVSEPGYGSRFWITARLAKLAPSEAAPVATEGALTSASASLSAGCTGRPILVVEDDPINQFALSELLTTLGCVVDAADNGQMALDKVQTRDYALVLMDLQMPLVDGLTATREIRRLPRGQNLPVIAMTANAFEEDRRACLDAGMNDFVAKPVGILHLQAILRHWLPKG